MARQLARSSVAAPFWIAAVSVAVTFLVWVFAAQSIEERDRARFDNAVSHVKTRIEDRMVRHVNLVRSTQAMVIVAHNLDRTRFKRFVEALNLNVNYRGMLGLGISMKIEEKEKDRIARLLKSQGLPNFTYHPPTKDKYTHAIVFLEPETASNKRALGYNMFTEKVRREAMTRAMREGLPALSGKVTLVQDGSEGDHPGFLLYYPIYETLVVPPFDQREKALLGFAYSPFRASELFERIFSSETEAHIQATVYDGRIVSPESLLYRPPQGVRNDNPRRTVTRQSEIAGRIWTIRYDTSRAYEAASNEALLYWIPPLGLIVTLVLTTLSWRQSKAAGRLAAQTAVLERQEFNQRLLADAGALLNASLDYEKTLASVARLAVPEFADWCSVDILDENGKIRRLAISHVNPERITWAKQLQEKYPPDPNAPTGVPHVLRTGESELYEKLTPDILKPLARDEEMARIIEEIGFSSAMVVPIVARGQTLGALSFVWAESGHHYDKDDLALAKEIGLRAGMAVDNAVLYQQAERERVEVSRLNTNLELLVRDRTSDLESAVSELEAFSYSVSHDLRAPLRAVDGFSRSLMEDYGAALDETGMGYLQRIRNAARRMDELISALLNLSRLTRAEMVRHDVDFTRLAEEVALDSRAEFGSNVEVVVQPGLTTNADERMLHVVLDNLIGNAVKFSSKSESPKVEVGFADDAFFVRDNGIGFNPEYSAKLFAPFERLHATKDYPGSGIGLATVHRIISRHGGKIWAESQEGQGATFYFTLS